MSTVFLFPFPARAPQSQRVLGPSAPLRWEATALLEPVSLSRSWNESCLQTGSARPSLESRCAKRGAGEPVMPRGKQEGRC